MTVTQCTFCGYCYDEWLGDCKNGVPPGVLLGEMGDIRLETCFPRASMRQDRAGHSWRGDLPAKANLAFTAPIC